MVCESASRGVQEMVPGRAGYSEGPTYELPSPGGSGEADIAEAKRKLE